MPAFKDITGQRFGRLVALRFVGKQGKQSMWACLCDCGAETAGTISNLGRSVTSCGCLHREKTATLNFKHGHTPRGARTSIYARWGAMMNRCSNPTDLNWRHYGGRGIKVCERWHNFQDFLADMGEPPPGLTLDRIDNDRDYSNDNCRWVTMKDQAANRRHRSK